jgi:hypothetical protein
MPTVWQRKLYGDSAWPTTAKIIFVELTGTGYFDFLKKGYGMATA